MRSPAVAANRDLTINPIELTEEICRHLRSSVFGDQYSLNDPLPVSGQAIKVHGNITA